MQRILFLAFAALCAAGASGNLWAHPVAFQGSVGVMSSFFPDERMLEVNYSLRHWVAPSARMYWYTPGTDRPDAVLGGVNFLLHRWNGDDYQANIYSETAFGSSRFTGTNRGAYYLGLQSDAETRKYYGLIHVSTLRNWSRAETSHYEVRAGIAPYVAEYDALHTWLILQADRYTHLGSKIRLSPFLRFFYRNVLWEIGSSLQGKFMLNTIIHF